MICMRWNDEISETAVGECQDLVKIYCGSPGIRQSVGM
jgi:hypothetical protein